MDDWKRSSAPGWENPPRLLTRSSRHGKPPHPPAPAHAPVPAWEKRFVTVVCGIPWKRLLEAKEVMSVYKNIVDWDDSGARENFENAKARFWAEINGLRCDIPPPAPDLYLDKVDYYAEVDPELIADLEKPPPPPPATSSYGLNSFFYPDRPVPVYGWGDEEEPVQSNWETPADKPVAPTGWGDEGWAPQNGFVVSAFSAAELDANKPVAPTGWGDEGWAPQNGFVVSAFSAAELDANNGWNDGDWNYTHQWEQKNSADSWNYNADWQQNNSWGGGQEWGHERNNSWGAWENKNTNYGRRNGNGRKRDGGQYGSRPTRSRYPGDNYQANNRWSDGREGNRMGYAYNNGMHDKQPLAMR